MRFSLNGTGIAIGAMLVAMSVAPDAGATPIAPQGSLTLALENFSNGKPYFVYSSDGGSAPTFNSTSGTYNNDGVSGTMAATSTVTIQGQRYINAVGTLNGVNNLGFHVGDLQTLVSSGTYPNGTYTASANLVISIDGLTFEFTSVSAVYTMDGNGGANQNDTFTGVMDPGMNTFGTDYSAGTAKLLLSLNQSDVQGGATIGYTVTLNVRPAPVPEPATAAMLGTGLIALGVLRRRRQGRNR